MATNGSSTQPRSSKPITIKVSPSELKTGCLTWQNLEVATRALARDGLVVLGDMISHQALDKLNQKMVNDATTLQSLPNSPYNFNKGNIQQDPPMNKEFFEPSIFINPIVAQVTSATLGPKPRLSFMSGNTAVKATKEMKQPTHTDADFDHPDIPFALVVNVPLITMYPENGSTEIWLGTHRETSIADQEGAHGDRASGRINSDLLEKQRGIRPPSQPVVEKGSVVVRDLRLWHGGCPNLEGKEARVMLAMIHFAPWYRNAMKVEFSEDLKPLLTTEKTGLQVQAEYFPDEEIEKRYLSRPYGNAYDFDQTEKIEGVF